MSHKFIYTFGNLKHPVALPKFGSEPGKINTKDFHL